MSVFVMAFYGLLEIKLVFRSQRIRLRRFLLATTQIIAKKIAEGSKKSCFEPSKRGENTYKKFIVLIWYVFKPPPFNRDFKKQAHTRTFEKIKQWSVHVNP